MDRSSEDQRRENEERERDRLLEANKHMSTLSASALAFVFGVERLGAEGFTAGPAVVVFSLALLSALAGLLVSTTTKPRPRQVVEVETVTAKRFFTVSAGLFYIGVLFVV